MDAQVTVVIPTLNRCDLLRECLASLREQTFTGFEVIVVDDGSSEDIAGCVCEHFPMARVLRRDENGGFARAVNDGLRAATSRRVMLLNNDMTPAPDCLERLMRGMDEVGAAMACPLTLFRDDPDVIYSAGDRVLPNGRPESIGFRQRRAEFDVDRHPFGVSAGAAMYEREVFERIGLFDETFVAYFEDADLCLRARKAGFEAVCVGEAIAYHVGSASLEGRTAWRTRQCYRNHALIVAKHFSARQMMRHAPAIFRERLHQTRCLISAYRVDRGLIRALGVWMVSVAELSTLLPRTLLARRAGAMRCASLSSEALSGEG